MELARLMPGLQVMPDLKNSISWKEDVSHTVKQLMAPVNWVLIDKQSLFPHTLALCTKKRLSRNVGLLILFKWTCLQWGCIFTKGILTAKRCRSTQAVTVFAHIQLAVSELIACCCKAWNLRYLLPEESRYMAQNPKASGTAPSETSLRWSANYKLQLGFYLYHPPGLWISCERSSSR